MNKISLSSVQFSIKPVKTFYEFEERVTKGIKSSKGSDFVIFPELFTIGLLGTFPSFKDFQDSDMKKLPSFTNRFMFLFKNLSIENGQYIVAGSHLVEEKGHYYNASFTFCSDGKIFEHKKTHIFPSEGTYNTSEGNKLDVLETEKVVVGVAICYEAEIPECIRILTLKGAKIVFCPSFTLSEHGFWRVRHCCQARCIENQIYMVHSCLVGSFGNIAGYGRSSILTPCEDPWPTNGVLAESETNKEDDVIRADVDIDQLDLKRETGVAPVHRDRIRRAELYHWLYK